MNQLQMIPVRRRHLATMVDGKPVACGTSQPRVHADEEPNTFQLLLETKSRA